MHYSRVKVCPTSVNAHPINSIQGSTAWCCIPQPEKSWNSNAVTKPIPQPVSQHHQPASRPPHGAWRKLKGPGSGCTRAMLNRRELKHILREARRARRSIERHSVAHKCRLLPLVCELPSTAERHMSKMWLFNHISPTRRSVPQPSSFAKATRMV